ncbi:MAG TPA: SsrA-binding protein [Flavobacteriales bacterium]|nr:SsrA-binding protein [Flavobacteriales bacterium]
MFKIINKLNRILLPSYVKRDLTRLNKIDKAIIAYRLWVTKKCLK